MLVSAADVRLVVERARAEQADAPNGKHAPAARHDLITAPRLRLGLFSADAGAAARPELCPCASACAKGSRCAIHALYAMST